MSSMIAFLKKPADKSELMAALEYFNPSKLNIFIFENDNRISEKLILEWDIHKNLEVIINKISKDKLSVKNLLNEILKIKDCKYIGLPIGNHRAFYKVMPTLKKKGYTTIHFSDGVNDSFSLIGFLLSIKAKSILGLLKSIYSYFEYKKSIADFCFYQLFPLKSCFAKINLAPKNENNSSLSLEVLNEVNKNEVDTLILSGFGVSTDDLVRFFKIKTNYCATSKNKEFNINGNIRVIDSFISAEDLICTNKIKSIYAVASTACYFVKIYNKNIQCKVYLDGGVNKNLGFFYQYYYIKIGKRLGLEFFKKKI